MTFDQKLDIAFNENIFNRVKEAFCNYSTPTIETGECLAKAFNDIALDEKKLAEFVKIYELLRRGIITDEFFIKSILDGAI